MENNDVPDSTPTVSTRISTVKGAEVLVQCVMGYVVAFISVKLSAKLGMPIDLAMQSQIVIVFTAVVSGILHGLWNNLTHRWPKLDVFKRFCK